MYFDIIAKLDLIYNQGQQRDKKVLFTGNFAFNHLINVMLLQHIYYIVITGSSNLTT